MRKIAHGNYLTGYLLVVCVLLAAVLMFQNRTRLGMPADVDAPAGAAPALVGRIRQENFSAPALAAFAEITARPLFTPGRQPPPKPDAAAPAAVNLPPLRLELEGIAITPEASIILVRDLGNNSLLNPSQGMKHQGWEVTEITADSAIFTRGEVSQELILDIDERPRQDKEQKPASARLLPRQIFRDFFNRIEGARSGPNAPPLPGAPARGAAPAPQETPDDAAPQPPGAASADLDNTQQ